MLFPAGPFKQRDTCNVMVDHLQSHVTPWRQYTSHVKVRGTLSKMNVASYYVDKYALWLNFRMTDDNKLHGSDR